MANKVVTTEDAFGLLLSKPQTIETLASAIVRGKGYSMTDSKTEFFKAYTETVSALESRLFGTLMIVMEPERFEALKNAKTETETTTETTTETETTTKTKTK